MTPTAKPLYRRELFYDPTETAIINLRILNGLYRFADQLNFSTEQKQHFFNALLLQAKKLVAIWTHYDRFKREVERLKQNAPTVDGKIIGSEPLELSYSQELYLEFDEFLVQYKSSLDYLAKLPAAFFGRRKWNPTTFGDKGQRIVRLLRSVLPKEKKHYADDFERTIFNAHKADIEEVITARDRVNHYLEGGIPFQQFAVVAVRYDDSITYRVPMWNEDQTVAEFMNVVFHNHLKFCEDFIVFFLFQFTWPGFGFLHERVDPISNVSPWKLIPEAALPSFLKHLEQKTGQRFHIEKV